MANSKKRYYQELGQGVECTSMDLLIINLQKNNQLQSYISKQYKNLLKKQCKIYLNQKDHKNISFSRTTLTQINLQYKNNLQKNGFFFHTNLPYSPGLNPIETVSPFIKGKVEDEKPQIILLSLRDTQIYQKDQLTAEAIRAFDQQKLQSILNQAIGKLQNKIIVNLYAYLSIVISILLDQKSQIISNRIDNYCFALVNPIQNIILIFSIQQKGSQNIKRQPQCKGNSSRQLIIQSHYKLNLTQFRFNKSTLILSNSQLKSNNPSKYQNNPKMTYVFSITGFNTKGLAKLNKRNKIFNNLSLIAFSKRYIKILLGTSCKENMLVDVHNSDFTVLGCFFSISFFMIAQIQ
ncbi:hypothetical protein ABPG74_011423 [Tetrahymena malaccensis]